MRGRFQIVGIFIAPGLGGLTVTLLHDRQALIPHVPYGGWILARLFVVASLASLGMVFVLGLEDGLADTDETDGSPSRPVHWGVIGLAYMIGALASAAFIGASALVDYLDRGAD
jgi:hypothetical protein